MWAITTAQKYLLSHSMLCVWENPAESLQKLQHYSPSPHGKSASQRAANAHTPESWESSRAKISIAWKNTYGCCRNEYDLWQVVWVCIKRAAHFKNQSLIWFVLLETILQSNLFVFFFPDRQRFQRYTRKQPTSVRFYLQVESKGSLKTLTVLL